MLCCVLFRGPPREEGGGTVHSFSKRILLFVANRYLLIPVLLGSDLV